MFDHFGYQQGNGQVPQNPQQVQGSPNFQLGNWGNVPNYAGGLQQIMGGQQGAMPWMNRLQGQGATPGVPGQPQGAMPGVAGQPQGAMPGVGGGMMPGQGQGGGGMMPGQNGAAGLSRYLGN
jgi:hypothetical protein